MEGQTAIITGANCGIGEATALEMAKRHARVIMACRDVKAGEEAVKYIRRYTSNGELVVMKLDLASLASVREFCLAVLAEEPHIDVLVNNAGVFQCPYSKTEDGLEMQMGVNHFGHFLLTNLLLERIKRSSPSRIIVVSSSLHRKGVINFDDINSEKSYDKKKGYNNSKLANAVFSRELSRRLEDTGVAVCCVHPGMVATNLSRHVVNRVVQKLLLPLLVLLGLQTAEEGCQTILYCAVASELENARDGYYGWCRREPWPGAASDLGAAKKLWELSETITGLKAGGGEVKH
jgi:retinol dehydrogenase-14